MSRIDKLSVSGVRSFSPHVREAIQFNIPLTLIVGYNGSGKTTIIECLKYATTGELPPNSKGGAFIHDPKLLGEKEVMAQVKLQFRSINDKQHVATRSLQLTVKKTTRSQKTLDCSLQVNNNGERTTTSTRQAQLDEMIPERLGVSPAILDAVIFCHQDESLWPLSEPSALKKRFDEIFEALKYTKAIDNLKVLRKKQVEQLGKLQNDEAHNKINKDRGERAEKRMSGLQAEIEGARDTCEALTTEMEETQDRIREKHEQANSFLQIVQNLRNKQEQLEYRQEAANELRSRIDELKEDDHSLEKSLTQYEEKMRVYQEEAAQAEQQYAKLQSELSRVRQELNRKLSEKGKHESDKDHYDRQLQTRTENIQHAATAHGFRGFDGDLSDEQIQSFNDKLQKLLNERKRDLERLRKENASDLDKATTVITELEGRKAAKIQDRLSAKQRMNAIEKRTGILQNESSRLDGDEGAKAVLDKQLEDLEERSSRLRQEFEAAQWDRQISEENDKLWQQENEVEKLGRELVECTRLASERAQLDLRKKEAADRQRKLKTLTSTWQSKLSNVLDTDDWQPETLEKNYHDVVEKQNRILEEARNRRETSLRKQQRVEYKLKNTIEAKEKATRNAEDCRKRVVTALQDIRDNAIVEDYIDEMDLLEGQVDDLKNELSLFDALVKYYAKCKKTLDQSKKCQLCDRHFESGQTSSIDRLAQKIEKQMNSKGKLETEEDLKGHTASLEKLRAVRPAYDTYTRLSGEVVNLHDESTTIQAEHDALDKQLEEEEAVVHTEEGKHSDIDELSKTVMNISLLVKDIKDSDTQIERIMSQQASGGSLRSPDEIHELQAGLNEQLKIAKNKVSKLTIDKHRTRDQLSAADLEKSELRNNISRASSQIDKKKDLQTQIQALKEDHDQQRETLQRTDQELEGIEPDIVEARSVRDHTLQRGRSKEQAVAEARDKIANSSGEIKMIETDIQNYIDRGGPSNLATNNRAISSLEKTISGTEKEIGNLTDRNNKLRQDIDSGDRKRKNIGDNLNYRKHLSSLNALKEDISNLEDRNAHEDYERLQHEARSLENQSNRLLAERGSVMGTMKSKDEELGRLLQEWETDYKNAKVKYRESHIRVETTKAAIEDLAQCGAAVDKAVMQFHTMKMGEVNRIAAELWQSTYQGTDIDTILIRSDNESSTGKRNYNYRLCMVKQDAEMDMRGRCSAGQKVLASIIIRLALAESFGVNCGLIALDEPTTNLDRDNIKSLAESLHMIIRARQAQSNFQLIVITHDEEFLRHMRCSDFCDSFYRVKRDEKQNSVISRESITKIF